MVARTKKGELTLTILTTAKDMVLSSGELIEAILNAGYGASISGMEYALSQNRRSRASADLAKELAWREHHRYYSLLYNLKQDGLLSERKIQDRKVLLLTPKGLKKWKSLRKAIKNRLPGLNYEIEPSENIVIVTFDIPEKEKSRREWLRAVLKNMKFKMIQRSVWLGRVKIPKFLVEDLRKLKMIDYVEIFEIGRTGSLRHIL